VAFCKACRHKSPEPHGKLKPKAHPAVLRARGEVVWCLGSQGSLWMCPSVLVACRLPRRMVSIFRLLLLLTLTHSTYGDTTESSESATVDCIRLRMKCDDGVIRSGCAHALLVGSVPPASTRCSFENDVPADVLAQSLEEPTEDRPRPSEPRTREQASDTAVPLSAPPPSPPVLPSNFAAPLPSPSGLLVSSVANTTRSANVTSSSRPELGHGRRVQSSRGVFSTRAALLLARDAWCTDHTNATATYGPIKTWDVSAITDMTFLFCGSSSVTANEDCNPACSGFNGDISSWNVASVTTMGMMVRRSPCVCGFLRLLSAGSHTALFACRR
jgi:surface protein